MTSWIRQGRKGWLKDYRIKKEKEPPKEEDKKEVGVIHVTENYGIRYRPIKCPKCGEKNVKCHTSNSYIRYYKCRQCNNLFKVIVVD